MTHHIIKTIRLAHCKRGPERCQKCREMNVERVCLLDIEPPQPGMLQRQVIEVEIAGERVWREFDLIRVFADMDEARAYAATHNVEWGEEI